MIHTFLIHLFGIWTKQNIIFAILPLSWSCIHYFKPFWFIPSKFLSPEHGPNYSHHLKQIGHPYLVSNSLIHTFQISLFGTWTKLFTTSIQVGHQYLVSNLIDPSLPDFPLRGRAREGRARDSEGHQRAPENSRKDLPAWSGFGHLRPHSALVRYRFVISWK